MPSRRRAWRRATTGSGDAIGTLGGSDTGSIQANGVWAAWPLAFGATPGAYAGAAILLGVPLALRARRRRAVVWAFGGALVITWVLMLDAVVTTAFIRDVFLRIPFGDVYLHNPGRMRYLAVIAVPVLGAVGIQGLRDEPLAPRHAIRLARGAGHSSGSGCRCSRSRTHCGSSCSRSG